MRIHDRSAKVAKRRRRMPVHGIAMKRLLVDRAAKAQQEAPVQEQPKPLRCMQCGKPATNVVVRDYARAPEFRTTWCDTHVPDVFAIVRSTWTKAQKERARAFDRMWQSFEGWEQWTPAPR